jgi:hypothetical protein
MDGEDPRFLKYRKAIRAVVERHFAAAADGRDAPYYNGRHASH